MTIKDIFSEAFKTTVDIHNVVITKDPNLGSESKSEVFIKTITVSKKQKKSTWGFAQDLGLANETGSEKFTGELEYYIDPKDCDCIGPGDYIKEVVAVDDIRWYVVGKKETIVDFDGNLFYINVICNTRYV